MITYCIIKSIMIYCFFLTQCNYITNYTCIFYIVCRRAPKGASGHLPLPPPSKSVYFDILHFLNLGYHSPSNKIALVWGGKFVLPHQNFYFCCAPDTVDIENYIFCIVTLYIDKRFYIYHYVI